MRQAFTQHSIYLNASINSTTSQQKLQCRGNNTSLFSRAISTMKQHGGKANVDIMDIENTMSPE